MVVVNDLPTAVQAPYWQLTLGTPAGYVDTIQIPAGMIALEDKARLLAWGGEVTARKIAVDEQQAALDGSVVTFRRMETSNQMVSLFNWIATLPGIGVLKSSHAQALDNKLAAAFNQLFKGNTNAVIDKLQDMIVQSEDLRDRGQFDPAFADPVIADINSIIDGLGF